MGINIFNLDSNEMHCGIQGFYRKSSVGFLSSKSGRRKKSQTKVGFLN